MGPSGENAMRYTVFDMQEDWGNEAPGLTLEEAFARLMALAGCDYSFARDGAEMRLLFQCRQSQPEIGFPDDEWMDFMNPDFRSAVADDTEARRSIMEQMIDNGLGHYCVMSDDRYRAAQASYFASSDKHIAPRVGTGWKAAS
jgi:hypothetical protein